MTINDNLPVGSTKLSPDDLNGLIPDYIVIRDDLNQFEKKNISEALKWLYKKKPDFNQILTTDFCLELHKRMFNKTWKWAGTYRTQTVNIGITPFYLISTHLRITLDNALYWIQNNSFPIDELCLRVHRDIVWVHPFPNGNGRFSRIICDALRYSLGSGYFLWGDFNGDVTHQTANRMAYINALREADKGNYQPLLNFVR